MKCSCCDHELSEKEIIWNPDIENWELCTTCLDVSLDAAYSDGFSRDEDDDKFVLLDDYDNHPDPEYHRYVHEEYDYD